MPFRKTALFVASLALSVPAAAQDWKGMARIYGTLTDPDGKPIAGATINAELPGRGGTTVKTDKKGQWALGGITTGTWSLDFEAPGFVAKKISVPVTSEITRGAPMAVKLEKPAGPPPELLAAVNRGDEAYKAGRYAEARTEYEKVLAMRPELGATLHELIARCYSQESNYAKAVEHLENVLTADPTNVNVRIVTAQEALRGGMLDKGMELLRGVDESQIKSADIFFNIAAILLNQQKPEDAIAYLTKAIAVDPAMTDAYFQRALAYLQLQKNAESKADFRKVIELAPQGPQADTARKALEQLK